MMRLVPRFFLNTSLSLGASGGAKAPLIAPFINAYWGVVVDAGAGVIVDADEAARQALAAGAGV